MTKRVLGIVIAAVFVATVLTFMYSENLTQSAQAAPPPQANNPSGLTERVSVTMTFNDDHSLAPGENIVVLDTTGSGSLDIVHVAANIPCGPIIAGGGNNAPDLKVVAGEATGTLTPFISTTAEDTGFVGADGVCVFHGTITPFGVGGPITDVILSSNTAVTVPLDDVTVTVTGTYN